MKRKRPTSVFLPLKNAFFFIPLTHQKLIHIPPGGYKKKLGFSKSLFYLKESENINVYRKWKQLKNKTKIEVKKLKMVGRRCSMIQYRANMRKILVKHNFAIEKSEKLKSFKRNH